MQATTKEINTNKKIQVTSSIYAISHHIARSLPIAAMWVCVWEPVRVFLFRLFFSFFVLYIRAVLVHDLQRMWHLCLCTNDQSERENIQFLSPRRLYWCLLCSKYWKINIFNLYFCYIRPKIFSKTNYGEYKQVFSDWVPWFYENVQYEMLHSIFSDCFAKIGAPALIWPEWCVWIMHMRGNLCIFIFDWPMYALRSENMRV